MIEAQVRLDERDFITAHREVAVLRRAMLVSSVVGLALILGGGACLFGALSELPVAGCAPLFVIGAGAVLLWRARTRGSREWRSMREWQARVRYRMSSGGLRIENEKEGIDQTWDLFAGWSEGESAFYVEQAGQRFQILPKRGFDGDAEVETVRSLLRENVRSRPELRGPRLRRGGPLVAVGLWMALVLMFVLIYQLVTSGERPRDRPADQVHQGAD